MGAGDLPAFSSIREAGSYHRLATILLEPSGLVDLLFKNGYRRIESFA